MRHHRLLGGLALSLALAVSAINPAVAADRKTTNTILGAGVGAAAGAILTEGDTLATLGGAAAGGVLGYVLTEEPRRRHHARPHRHHPPKFHRGKPPHAHYVSLGKGKGKHHGAYKRHHRHAHR